MIEVIQHRDREAGEHLIGKCACGRTVEFYSSGDQRCDCGRWYNSSGQELRPPEEWGEETGERFGPSGNYLGGGDD